MNKTKGFLIFSITIILTLLAAPFFGTIYKYVYESISGSDFGGCGMTLFCFKHPEYFEGFFISYYFFATLAISIFSTKKRYILLAAFLLPMFLLQISVLESLIVSAGAAVIAWVIAMVVLTVKKKIHKK
jgi:hypothetical protein